MFEDDVTRYVNTVLAKKNQMGNKTNYISSYVSTYESDHYKKYIYISTKSSVDDGF